MLQRITLLGPVYVAYLCFQLYSHKDLFDDSGEGVNNSTRYAASQRHLPNQSPGDSVSEDRSSAISEEQEEEEETPKMSSWVATMLLVIVTIVRPLLIVHWPVL